MASLGFNDSLKKLKYISTRRAKVLIKHNIHTIRDIIYYFPRKHLNRTNVTLIKNIIKGSNYNIVGKVEAFDEKRTRFKKIFRVIISDNTGIITCTWFNSVKFIKKLFNKGDTVAIHGKVEWYNGFVINHPEFDILDGDENPTNTGSIIPIYPLTNDFRSIGFEQRVIRKIISQIINDIDFEQDNINQSYLDQHNMMNIDNALKQIHFPENRKSLNEAIFRLKFDEHLLLQILMVMRKNHIKSAKTKPLKFVGPYFRRVRDLLQFELTYSQKKVLEEIHTDLKSGICMNRLLQGDVGSGKTIVAILSALLAVGNNVQVALMAPTEILASQHFETFNKELKKVKITCCLLVGSMKKKERDNILKNIKSGAISIIIGTHAIIQEDVYFNDLRFIIIDEQHRFGVSQRNMLIKKGNNPNLLSMTATPIPRTLSITYMGDMDLSIIDELPSNRVPVITKTINHSRLSKVYTFIKDQVKSGKQCMIVYPLVEESEKIDIAAAVEAFKVFDENIFSEIKVGLVHGKMSSQDKKQIMERFSNNKVKILVSTTVIEVGINVPNATIMLVEHAERFGLTQLHQLRGRVGRGSDKSYCILVNRGSSEKSSNRLEIMERTNDGFKIADEDLILRGPGDYIGFQQSGFIKYKIANLITDGGIIKKARNLAIKIIQEDPLLENYNLIKNQLKIDYKENLEMIKLN